MKLYYVVSEGLYGVPDGEVHGFSDQKAGPLIVSGALQAFDPKNKRHTDAKAAQEKRSDDRRLAQEELLKLERTDPVAYQKHVVAQREANEKAAAKRAQEEQEEERRALIARAADADRLHSEWRRQAAAVR